MQNVSSDLRNNTAASRFELDAEGETAVAYYRLADGIMTLTHTETPPRLRGRGIASRLVRGVLEQVRAQELKVIPQCAFVAAYMARHPEFNDLLS